MNILVFCGVAAFAFFRRAECFTGVKNDMVVKIKECSGEVGVSEDSAMKALAGDFSEESKLKNLAFCFGKKIGFIDENGKRNIENPKEKLKMVISDDKQIDAIMADCSKLGATLEDTFLNNFKCMLKVYSN